MFNFHHSHRLVFESLIATCLFFVFYFLFFYFLHRFQCKVFTSISYLNWFLVSSRHSLNVVYGFFFHTASPALGGRWFCLSLSGCFSDLHGHLYSFCFLLGFPFSSHRLEKGNCPWMGYYTILLFSVLSFSSYALQSSPSSSVKTSSAFLASHLQCSFGISQVLCSVLTPFIYAEWSFTCFFSWYIQPVYICLWMQCLACVHYLRGLTVHVAESWHFLFHYWCTMPDHYHCPSVCGFHHISNVEFWFQYCFNSLHVFFLILSFISWCWTL